MAENKQWRIEYGIHRGTFTSRTSGKPQSFATREEAAEFYYKHKSLLKKTGYVFWYCVLIDPQGERETLENNRYSG